MILMIFLFAQLLESADRLMFYQKNAYLYDFIKLDSVRIISFILADSNVFATTENIRKNGFFGIL